MANLGGGSSSSSNAIEAGEAYVKISARVDNLEKALKESKKKLEESGSEFSKWHGKVKASFEQSAGAARNFGVGIAAMAASGTTDLKSLTLQVVGSLGPWGMLAASVIAVGSALGDMIAKGKEAVSTLDKVRKSQFDAAEIVRKKSDADVIGEFQKIATKEQRAEFTRMEKFGGPSDPKKREEYVSAISIAFARETVETLQRESQSVGGMVGGIIAQTFAEAVAQAAPRLKLNFQNENDNAILGGGGLVAGGLSALDRYDSLQGSTAFATAFMGVQASLNGLAKMTSKEFSQGGYYSSGQTYGNLGSIEDQQLKTLERIEDVLEKIAGKEGTWSP